MKLIIKNGEIVDGTGRPRYPADLVIEKGKINAIGNWAHAKGDVVIDAKGLFVAPGFVDILNHSDAYVTLFTSPTAESLVRQGITTILIGNCGSSLAPIFNEEGILSLQKWADIRELNIGWFGVGEFLDELSRRKRPINIATLVGHATIRRALTHGEFRDLTPKEIEKMQFTLKTALAEGAFGMSFGLAYSHAKIAPPEELNILMRDLANTNALASVHLKDEGKDFLGSVNEILQIVRSTHVTLEISHFKVIGKDYWTQFGIGLDMVKRAHESGLPVTADVYPYLTIGSVLYIFLPDWAARGGKHMLLARLREPAIRKKIIEDMKEAPIDWRSIVVAESRPHVNIIGKNIADIAALYELSPEETIMNLLLASSGRTIIFAPGILEDNLAKAVSAPFVFIGSDGFGYDVAKIREGELVHPRSFGAFPRALREFVVTKKLVPWETMIYKMTDGPARKIGLQNRGRIEKGYAADITVLNPATIQDRATFQNPYQYAEGIEWVIVNGEVVLEKGTLTGKMAGKVLRRMS